MQPDLRILRGDLAISADFSRLVQVFNNLLSNAIKFTPAGGQIVLAAAAEPGGVRIKVSDTGMGIQPEKLPRLFDRFHVKRTPGTEGEKGFGLGLAIVRQIVELHGGWVEVSSLPGTGTAFSVHLPEKRVSREIQAQAEED